MEFWGVEVKSGEPLKVSPGDGMILHLSQACLGEMKKGKGNESVYLSVNVDGKKFVLGTLFTEKLPQQQFDLVFDTQFELSHNSKNGSVYFYGYKAINPYEDEPEEEESESDESESDEDIPLTVANNGKPESEATQEKPVEVAKANAAKGKESDSGKQKVKIVEPNKDVNPEEDDESSDGDSMSEDDDDDDSQGEDDTDESDDESAESDEETPKKAKAEPSKKRPAESATKTPVQDKKAKVTPQRTDGKKVSGHVATPHPAKQAGKTPANKPNQQTPKSGEEHTCKSCSRSFKSEQGLDSHTKAKHGGGK